jgi:hypothetical protein
LDVPHILIGEIDLLADRVKEFSKEEGTTWTVWTAWTSMRAMLSMLSLPKAWKKHRQKFRASEKSA